MALDRRSFLKGSGAALVGGTAAAAPLTAFMANPALADVRPNRRNLVAPNNGGYGAIAGTPALNDDVVYLALPSGFEYVVFGKAGDMGDDGFPTPDRHDGMATFPGAAPGLVNLVRNHERGYSPVPAEGGVEGEEAQPLVGNPDYAYDRNSGGACTSMTFDTNTFELVSSRISINGTSVNCAGGHTPWGTWLTCEETTNGTQSQFSDESTGEPIPGLVYEQDHGYVFEVPSDGTVVTEPVALKDMGRFVHEAVAIDPTTGIIYETEDNNPSGFYRFLPNVLDDLSAGGRLQMLAIDRRPNYDTRTRQRVGESLPVRWVDITDPDPTYPTDFDDSPGSLVFQQGFDQGGATFARLEGCWYGERAVYINSTSGGDQGLGQVWEFRPGPLGGQLTLIFESPSANLLDAPDNITVSPRGGLLLCEDGDDVQFVRGLDRRGRIFDFAQNLVSENIDQEFAGATFSPDGRVLFVNIQTPGLSFAIRGPWSRGDV